MFDLLTTELLIVSLLSLTTGGATLYIKKHFIGIISSVTGLIGTGYALYLLFAVQEGMSAILSPLFLIIPALFTLSNIFLLGQHSNDFIQKTSKTKKIKYVKEPKLQKVKTAKPVKKEHKIESVVNVIPENTIPALPTSPLAPQGTPVIAPQPTTATLTPNTTTDAKKPVIVSETLSAPMMETKLSEKEAKPSPDDTLAPHNKGFKKTNEPLKFDFPF